MKIGEIFARLGIDDTEFQKKLKEASKSLENTGRKLQTIGGMLSGAITLPLLGVGTASLKMASQVVESENLFKVSMGKMADAARKWSTELSKSLGLNEYEIRKNVGVLYQMMSSMGLTEEEAYRLSTRMTELAYDMASFYNLSPEEAFEKLKSGIVGMVKPLEDLGISVHETTVQTWALKNGLIKQGEEMTMQQKILARFNVILEQTKNAHGDLARTISSPTNQMRVLRAQIEETMTKLGMALLPIMQAGISIVRTFVDKLASLVNAFTSLPKGIQIAVILFTGFLATLGPTLFTLGTLLKMLGSLQTIFPALAPAITGMLRTLGSLSLTFMGVASAAAVAGAGVLLVIDNIKRKYSEEIEAIREGAEQQKIYWDAIKRLKEKEPALYEKVRQSAIDYKITLTEAFQKVMQEGGATAEKIKAYMTEIEKAHVEKKDPIKSSLKELEQAFKQYGSEGEKAHQKTKTALQQVNEELTRAKSEYQNITANITQYRNALFQLNYLQAQRNLIEQEIQERVQTAIALEQGKISIIESETIAQQELNQELSETAQALSVISTLVAENMPLMNQQFIEHANTVNQELTKIKMNIDDYRKLIDDLTRTISNASQRMMVDWIYNLGEMIAGTQKWKDVSKNLFESFKEVITDVMHAIVQAVARSVVETVLLEKARALATVISKAIASLPFPANIAAAAGAVAAVSALFARIRLAEGGLVMRETTALIAEREPELVIPLSKFERMIQPASPVIEIQPVVLPAKHLEGWVIEFVQKAVKNERLLIHERGLYRK